MSPGPSAPREGAPPGTRGRGPAGGGPARRGPRRGRRARRPPGAEHAERAGGVGGGLGGARVSGATYSAAKGQGAHLNGRPIHARPFDPEDSLFSVYLGTHAAPAAAEVASRARRVRNLGAASLDLGLVAKGAADLYYMHSAVHETKLRAVDIAAGVLLVREAGGRVAGLGGGGLDMPLRPG